MGIGNVVLCPCITSEPKSKGIFNLDSFIAMSCACFTFSAPITPNSPPTFPDLIFPSTSVLTTDPVSIPEPGVIRLSCPIFSSTVIFAINAVMNAFIFWSWACICVVNNTRHKSKRIFFMFYRIIQLLQF